MVSPVFLKTGLQGRFDLYSAERDKGFQFKINSFMFFNCYKKIPAQS
jgi:hypothetical protein